MSGLVSFARASGTFGVAVLHAHDPAASASALYDPNWAGLRGTHLGTARMQFVINFGLTPEAAILTTSGVARVADFRKMNEALVDDARFQPGMSILVDHTALDVSELTAMDVRAIGEYVAEIGERIGPSTIAVVVPDRLTFGFVRMGEMRANQPQLNVKIFYSLAEGVEWLQKQPPAEPAGIHA